MSEHGIGAWTRGYKDYPRKSTTRIAADIPYKHSEHEFPDYLSHDGAKLLVDKIAAYWDALGFVGLVLKVQPTTNRGGQTVWAIRSNMVRGIPPR